MPYNVENIKQVPIVDFATRRYGHVFRGRGSEVQLELEGELSSVFVNTSKNIFRRFSSGAGGSIIDYVMHFEGVDFKGACQIISDQHGFTQTNTIRRSKVKKAEQKKKLRIEPEWVRICQQRLTEKGKEYWYGRGITAEALEIAAVGQIYRYGKDWFTFPVFIDNKVAFLKLRLCPWEDGAKASFFPAGWGAHLFGTQFIMSTTDTIYICEGESDVLAALSHGLVAVSGTNGAGTWLDSWNKEFSQVQNIVVAYDTDTAGQEGQQNVVDSLYKSKLPVSYFQWPEGFSGDLCTYFQTHNHV